MNEDPIQPVPEDDQVRLMRDPLYESQPLHVIQARVQGSRDCRYDTIAGILLGFKEVLISRDNHVDILTLRRAVEEVEVHLLGENQFDVEVIRTGTGIRTLRVTGHSQQDAEDQAIEAAGSESFSEHNSEYSSGGATKVKNG